MSVRKIVRQELSERTQRFLRRRAALVEGDADPVRRCKTLWASRRNAAFREIRGKLEGACSGRVRCMYCEDSEATDIEHFYPKSAYPLRGFDWENYLLACSNCNSNYKRTLFPLTGNGLPLLINPMHEDPMEHLVLSLTTGKFVPKSEQGAASISVFGLDRQVLEVGRRDAWAVLCALAQRYASVSRDLSFDEVEGVVAALRNQSFSCVSLFAVHYSETGSLVHVASPGVVAAISDVRDVLRALR